MFWFVLGCFDTNPGKNYDNKAEYLLIYKVTEKCQYISKE